MITIFVKFHFTIFTVYKASIMQFQWLTKIWWSVLHWLFTLVQYTSKSSFSSWFFYLLIRFEHKINSSKLFLPFTLGLNLEFSFQLSKCKLKHDQSFVYITKICVFCISWPVTLKFGLTIRDALLKHCKHLKGRIKFRPKSRPCPFNNNNIKQNKKLLM